MVLHEWCGSAYPISRPFLNDRLVIGLHAVAHGLTHVTESDFYLLIEKFNIVGLFLLSKPGGNGTCRVWTRTLDLCSFNATQH